MCATGVKPRLLLHVCCAGCAVYVAQELERDHDVTFFYFNPNIFPSEEYEHRLADLHRIADRVGIPVLATEYVHADWLDFIAGHERDFERGERCRLCFRYRLEKTAQTAKNGGYDSFTTTLSTSRYKLAADIFAAAQAAARSRGVSFYEQDFKKHDGENRSVALSRELGLYRQDYCGCEFSRKHER
jgi:epoxyqueuosine reductase